MDLFELGVKIDTTQVVQADKALKDFVATTKEATQTQTKASSVNRNVATSYKGISSSVSANLKSIMRELESTTTLTTAKNRLDAVTATYKSLLDSTIITQTQYNQLMEVANTKYRLSEMRINNMNTMLGMTGDKTRLARHEMLNLSYQLQDIIVGFASGQRPMTIFVQQGSQIAGIAASAGLGLKGMASAMWGMARSVLATTAAFMLNPLVLSLTAVIGGATLAVRSFNASLNENVDRLEVTRIGLQLTESQFAEYKKNVEEAGGANIGFLDTLKAMSSKITGTRIGFIKGGIQTVDAEAYAKEVQDIRNGEALAKALKSDFDSANRVIETDGQKLKREYEARVSVIKNMAEAFRLQGIPITEQMNVLLREQYLYYVKTAGAADEYSKAVLKSADANETAYRALMGKFNPNQQLEEDIQKIQKYYADLGINTSEMTRKMYADIKKVTDDFYKTQNKDQNKLAEKRSDIISQTLLGYDNEIAKASALTEAQKTQIRLKELENRLSTKGFAKLTVEEISQIRSKITVLTEANKVAEEYNRIQGLVAQAVTNAKTPLDIYKDTVTGVLNAYTEGKIEIEAYNKLWAIAKDVYEKATKPLSTYVKTLDQEMLALVMTTEERESYNYQLQLEEAYSQELLGASDARTKVIREEIDALVARKRAFDSEKSIRESLSKYTSGVENNTKEQNLVNEAYKRGVINQGQYIAQTQELRLSMSDLNVEMNKGSMFDFWASSAHKAFGTVQNGLVGVRDAFSNVFSTLSQGMGDAIADAVLTGKSFTEAFANVAQSAVKSLISTLIQLAIRMAVINALGGVSTVGTYATSTGTATGVQGITYGSGWNTTFSSPIPGAASGGYAGDVPVDQMAGVYHGKEFIVNANATAKNRALLEAINAGKDVSGVSSMSKVEGSTPNVQVNVINQSSNQVNAQQSSPSFNGKEWVMNIILTDYNNGGAMYKLVNGMV